MKRMKLAMVLGVGLEVGMGTLLAAQRPGVTAEDYYRIREVGEVAMAPDGRHVAYTVVNILEKENRRRAELFLVPVVDGATTGEAQRLSAASADVSQLRWSPDGTVLGYQSREAGRSGIEFRRVSAPAAGVSVPGVRGAPTWSRDGAWIAFTWAVPADTGLTGARARAGWIAPDARTRTLDAERMDGRVITAMAYKADGTLELLPHPTAMRHRQLYVVPAAGGQPTPLTSLPFAVSEPVWSSDGRHLYFSGRPFRPTGACWRFSRCARPGETSICSWPRSMPPVPSSAYRAISRQRGISILAPQCGCRTGDRSASQPVSVATSTCSRCR